MVKWDLCVDTDVKPIISDKELPVFIGVDASVKHDSTAVVAVTMQDQRVRLVTHRIFQPSPSEPLDFEVAIEETLIDLCGRFAVHKILFDPYQMQASAQRLQKKGLPIREFPQTSPNLTIASQNLYELIEGRNLILYPDAAMRLSASRAIAIETSRGWRIAKEKQSHKIDVIVALGMAAHAATSQPVEQRIPLVGPILVGQPMAIPGQSTTQAYLEWAASGGGANYWGSI
jgi:phage terminase large subunit-like protein